MKNWNELSMAEKADIMKLAIEGGVYDLDSIKSGYNKFAEGGGMEEPMNTIPEDYTPLASPTWQPVIDKMKQDSYKSNVEDFVYRVQKMHPEITQQQVEEAYKSIPIIASDSRRGRETGKYVYGDESGYGQRIMLYPNRMKEDQGVGGLTREDQLRSAMGHETNHLYVHTLLRGNYTDEEKALLDAAYPDDLFHVPEGGNIYDEKRAYNMQVRKALSEAYGNLVGADYDKATEKMKPDDVMWNYSQLGTGYMSDYQKVKQKYKKGSKWDQNQVDAILKATKDVAYNPTVNPYEYEEGVNYAALGGPIVEAAMNEFAKGGDTNPYTVGATVDALYASNPREEYLGEPSHHYDFTQSEEWANEHGYYPDARGHRDDRVKKPAHPSHPSRGTWDGDKFELTDLGMQNPNYTLFGLTDGGQDPQAVLTYQGGIVLPEVTVTPNENYFYNPYDNIILHQKANGGKIHIKPSHRGRLTELKKRTGKTEAELYRTGSPATRKMITFARNARKWKHGDGGNLYPGGGFMGLMPIAVPAALRGIGNAVKERAYKTITPQSYNISKAAKEFISGKERNLNGIEPERNEEWARYLGVPYNGESNFEPSPYRPQKGKTYDTVLRFKDESKILSDDVLNQMLDRQRKTGKNSWLVTGNGGGLGTYTLSLGEDENGKYISYYDDWDINPFKGISARTKIPFVSTIEDIVPGSNPFTVYGRRYYEKTNSKKHNLGGNLFSGEEELI